MEYKEIKDMLETSERLAESIKLWNLKNKKVYQSFTSKIESKGESVFTRKEKIAISEWWDIAQMNGKLISYIFILQGKTDFSSKKYPYLFNYIKMERFYPPMTLQ